MVVLFQQHQKYAGAISNLSAASLEKTFQCFSKKNFSFQTWESRGKESGDEYLGYKDWHYHYLGTSEVLELEILYKVHSNAT